MGIIKKLAKKALKAWLEREAPTNRLDREIWYVQRAIRRIESEIDVYDQEWSDSDGACCPSCMFGGDPHYRWLYEKLKRQEAWLKVLKDRQSERDKPPVKAESPILLDNPAPIVQSKPIEKPGRMMLCLGCGWKTRHTAEPLTCQNCKYTYT